MLGLSCFLQTRFRNLVDRITTALSETVQGCFFPSSLESIRVACWWSIYFVGKAGRCTRRLQEIGKDNFMAQRTKACPGWLNSVLVWQISGVMPHRSQNLFPAGDNVYVLHFQRLCMWDTQESGMTTTVSRSWPWSTGALELPGKKSQELLVSQGSSSEIAESVLFGCLNVNWVCVSPGGGTHIS